MASHRRSHVATVHRPQPGRVLDVGEPERHRPRRNAQRRTHRGPIDTQLLVLAEDQRLQFVKPWPVRPRAPRRGAHGPGDRRRAHRPGGPRGTAPSSAKPTALRGKGTSPSAPSANRSPHARRPRFAALGRSPPPRGTARRARRRSPTDRRRRARRGECRSTQRVRPRSRPRRAAAESARCRPKRPPRPSDRRRQSARSSRRRGPCAGASHMTGASCRPCAAAPRPTPAARCARPAPQIPATGRGRRARPGTSPGRHRLVHRRRSPPRRHRTDESALRPRSVPIRSSTCARPERGPGRLRHIRHPVVSRLSPVSTPSTETQPAYDHGPTRFGHRRTRDPSPYEPNALCVAASSPASVRGASITARLPPASGWRR